MITNYELKNELLIFWTNGVKKIQFANNLIILSIILLVIQIIIGSLISPTFQYKARSFLKNSDISFFTSLIKEGKFINVVDGLTIFIQSKESDGSFSNIFIDDSSKTNTKMISANNGEIIDFKNQKVFRLYNGKVINKEELKINVFEFDQIDFSLSDYSTNTILVPKIQEISSKKLGTCLLNLIKNKNYQKKNKSFSCEYSLKEDILQELFKRFYKPLYIPIIAVISVFLIILPKNNFNYVRNRNIIFISCFITLIISEISLRYSATSNISIISYLVAPWIFFLLIYLLFYKKVKNV